MPLGHLLLSLLEVSLFAPWTIVENPAELLDGDPATGTAVVTEETLPWVELRLVPDEPAPGAEVRIILTPDSAPAVGAAVTVNNETAVEHEFAPTREIELPLESDEELRSVSVRLFFEGARWVEPAEVELYGDAGPYGLRLVRSSGAPPYPEIIPGLYGPVPTWREARELRESYGGELVRDLSGYELPFGVTATRRLALFDYYYLWRVAAGADGTFYALYRGTFEMEPFSGDLAWFNPAVDERGRVRGVWGADLDPTGGRALVGLEHTVLDWDTGDGDEPLDRTGEIEDLLGPRREWEPYTFFDGFIGNLRVNELHYVDLDDGSLVPLGVVGAREIRWGAPDDVYLGRSIDGYLGPNNNLEWYRWNPGAAVAPQAWNQEPPPSATDWISETLTELNTAAGITFSARDGAVWYTEAGNEYRLGPGEPLAASPDGRYLLCLIGGPEDWLAELVVYELAPGLY